MYEYRREFLENHVGYKNFPIIRTVKADTVGDHEEALSAHKSFLKTGYEGSIYRNRVGRYRSTRSYGLMKFKDFSDAEATIVGYELGKGKRTGTLGKFIMMDDEELNSVVHLVKDIITKI